MAYREITISDANGRQVIRTTTSVEKAYVPPFTWTVRDLNDDEAEDAMMMSSVHSNVCTCHEPPVAISYDEVAEEWRDSSRSKHTPATW